MTFKYDYSTGNVASEHKSTEVVKTLHDRCTCMVHEKIKDNCP
jgi:hypothetical protein